MDKLVWDQWNEHVLLDMNLLLNQHMLYNFFTIDTWHLQRYAKMKAKEHSKLQEDIETLQSTKPEDHSLETLIMHLKFFFPAVHLGCQGLL